MRFQWKALTILTFLISATGCSKSLGPKPTTSATPVHEADGPGMVDVQQGKALYSQSCQVCHGAVEATGINNKTADQILTAINFEPAMKTVSGLKRLSADDLKDIAGALKLDPPVGSTPVNPAPPTGGNPSPNPNPNPSPNPNPNPTPDPSPNPNPNPSPNPSPVDGQALYTNNCQICHGAIAGSDIRGKKYLDIVNAINGVTQMKSLPGLKVLKEPDIIALETALAFITQPPTNPTTPTTPQNPEPVGALVKASFAGRLMGRNFVADILEEVFTSTSAGNDPSALLNRVRLYPGKYGEACNVYSTYSGADCNDAPISNSTVGLMPESTVVRQLDKVVVCENLLHKTPGINAVLEKVGAVQGTTYAPVSEQTITQVFKLFFRSRSPAAVEVQALKKFGDKLKAPPASLPVVDQWRSIIQVICEHPGWKSV